MPGCSRLFAHESPHTPIGHQHDPGVLGTAPPTGRLAHAGSKATTAALPCAQADASDPDRGLHSSAGGDTGQLTDQDVATDAHPGAEAEAEAEEAAEVAAREPGPHALAIGRCASESLPVPVQVDLQLAVTQTDSSQSQSTSAGPHALAMTRTLHSEQPVRPPSPPSALPANAGAYTLAKTQAWTRPLSSASWLDGAAAAAQASMARSGCRSPVATSCLAHPILPGSTASYEPQGEAAVACAPALACAGDGSGHRCNTDPCPPVRPEGEAGPLRAAAARTLVHGETEGAQAPLHAAAVALAAGPGRCCAWNDRLENRGEGPGLCGPGPGATTAAGAGGERAATAAAAGVAVGAAPEEPQRFSLPDCILSMDYSLRS